MRTLRRGLTLGLTGLLALTALTLTAQPPASAQATVTAAPQCELGISTIADCFPDPVLADAVAQTLNLPTTAPLQETAAQRVTWLYGLEGLVTFEGIAVLQNINEIWTWSKSLVEISPLGDLKNLDTLIISDAPLTNVGVLSSVHSLRLLSLQNLPITDLTQLAGLQSVETLKLSDMPISNVAPLLELASLVNLTLERTEVTDASQLAAFTNLNELWLQGTPVRDVSMLPAELLQDWRMVSAAANVLPFSRGSSTGSVTLFSGISPQMASFGSRYTIDGFDFTYVYRGGGGSSTLHSLGSEVEELFPLGIRLGVGTSAPTVRGDVITSTYGPFDRSAERRVSPSGRITHTVTLTNTTEQDITTRAYEMADTELSWGDTLDDAVPVASNGRDGFMISNEAMTVYFDGGENIDRVITTDFNDRTIRDAVEAGSPLQAPAAESIGVPTGEVLLTGVDSTIYYVTNEFTVAPGQSFTYSFSESIYAGDEQPTVTVEYVDGEGSPILTDDSEQVFTGADEAELSLTTDNLVPPAGYIIDPAFALPVSITYGDQGLDTRVKVPVVLMPTPITHTVTFDTQGGSSIAAVTVADGNPIALPANPTRKGYAFSGWTLDVAGAKSFAPDSAITADLTLYAKWTAVAPGGGGTRPAEPNATLSATGARSDPSGLNWGTALGATLLVAGAAALAIRRRHANAH